MFKIYKKEVEIQIGQKKKFSYMFKGESLHQEPLWGFVRNKEYADNSPLLKGQNRMQFQSARMRASWRRLGTCTLIAEHQNPCSLKQWTWQITWSTKLWQRQIQENHLKNFSLATNPHCSNIFIFLGVRLLCTLPKSNTRSWTRRQLNVFQWAMMSKPKAIDVSIHL